MTFEIFMKSLRFETPWVRKDGFYESVYLSVVGCVRNNFRQNYQIELSLGTLYRSRKSKDKFVNQLHPIKIEGLSTSFVYLKKTFWKSQKFHYWFLIVLINLFKLSS